MTFAHGITFKLITLVASPFYWVLANASETDSSGLKTGNVAASSTPDAFGVSTSLVSVTLNLGLVLIAIVVLAWLFKRFQGMDQPASGQLKVTASLPLGPKERILVVEVGDEQILVGATSTGINALHVLNAPLNTDTEDSETFSDKLMRSLKGTQTP